jgi:hypothetical protein
MNESELYTLEFLLDGSEFCVDGLRDKINDLEAIDLLRDEAPEVKIEQAPSVGSTECLRLSIEGSLEEVDYFHWHLRDGIVDQYPCILLRDDAGAEIRQRAYPILAELEQSLRSFINRGMTEILGFDWWEGVGGPCTTWNS